MPLYEVVSGKYRKTEEEKTYRPGDLIELDEEIANGLPVGRVKPADRAHPPDQEATRRVPPPTDEIPGNKRRPRKE